MRHPRNQPFKSSPRINPGLNFSWAEDRDMSDEFERKPTSFCIRRHQWKTESKDWLGRAPSFFKKENVIFGNGSLKLRSREDAAPSGYPRSYKHFSTAFVRTNKARLYGYFEIYCRLMDSKISSAFWFTNNQPHIWTEINVFEYSTSDKPNEYKRPYCQLFNTNMHVHRHPEGIKYNSPKVYDMEFDLSTEPIKVGFNWQADKMEWYFNDRLVRREENRHFHQPLHLQLDSESFPHWFGLPEIGGCHKNTLPNAFEIFYVRTWYR